jgi:hypothetical protein
MLVMKRVLKGRFPVAYQIELEVGLGGDLPNVAELARFVHVCQFQLRDSVSASTTSPEGWIELQRLVSAIVQYLNSEFKRQALAPPPTAPNTLLCFNECKTTSRQIGCRGAAGKLTTPVAASGSSSSVRAWRQSRWKPRTTYLRATSPLRKSGRGKPQSQLSTVCPTAESLTGAEDIPALPVLSAVIDDTMRSIKKVRSSRAWPSTPRKHDRGTVGLKGQVG